MTMALRQVYGAPVPPSEPMTGREADMVENDAGGFVFAMGDWGRLERFPAPRHRGRHLLRRRARAEQGQRGCRGALSRRGRPARRRHGCGPQRVGPRAVERAGAVRARDGRKPRRREDAQGRDSGAAAGGAHRYAPAALRRVRGRHARVGPGAQAGRAAVVHRQERRRARVPDAEVPGSRRLDAARRPAPRASAAEGRGAGGGAEGRGAGACRRTAGWHRAPRWTSRVLRSASTSTPPCNGPTWKARRGSCASIGGSGARWCRRSS